MLLPAMTELTVYVGILSPVWVNITVYTAVPEVPFCTLMLSSLLVLLTLHSYVFVCSMLAVTDMLGWAATATRHPANQHSRCQTLIQTGVDCTQARSVS